jgi:hypothetical protein
MVLVIGVAVRNLTTKVKKTLKKRSFAMVLVIS